MDSASVDVKPDTREADKGQAVRLASWWTLCLLFVAAIISYLDRQALNLLIDPVRRDLGLSDIGISLLQGAAFAVLYSIAGLPLGRMADRTCRKCLIMIGMLVWSAATVAGGLATSFGQLFAARVLVGIGEAALAPAAQSLIGDLFPPHKRGLATAIFVMGMISGSGIAVAVSGYLLDAAAAGAFQGWPVIGDLAPWRVVLVLCGLPGILLVAVILLTSSEPPRRQTPGYVGEPVMAFVRREWRRLWPVYVGMAMVSIGNYAMISWMPALLMRRFELSAGEVGAQLGVVAIVAGIIGALSAGSIADLLQSRGMRGAKLTVAFWATLLSLPAAAIGFAGSAGLALALAGLWILATVASGAVVIAALQDLLPAEFRGTGASVAAFCGTMIGLGVGPTAVALLTERVFADPLSVGLSMSCIMFLGGLAGTVLMAMARRRNIAVA